MLVRRLRFSRITAVRLFDRKVRSLDIGTNYPNLEEPASQLCGDLVPVCVQSLSVASVKPPPDGRFLSRGWRLSLFSYGFHLS